MSQEPHHSRVPLPKAIPSSPIVDKPVWFGIAIIIIFLGGFFFWSAMAPLESAAVAMGKITVDTNRKTIQHLEGGIIKKIFVKEGSLVEAGEPLIKLEETQARANLDLLRGEKNALVALESRLISERDDVESVKFPEFLLAEKEDLGVEKMIRGQMALFTTRKRAYDGNIRILNQRIEQLKNEVESLESQAKANDTQYKLINEELESVAFLEKKKYIDRSRLLQLQREAAKFAGDRDESLALVARTKQKIGETETQIISMREERLKDILEELRETQRKQADVQERFRAAQDILKRTLIVAPEKGTVVKLEVHTVGGVISPGSSILDMVPVNDSLVIEAFFNPLDIDVVRPGLKARVGLLAFKQRTTATLNGEVIYVSADAFSDERTGNSYYVARITIPPEEIQRVANVKLYPGMPAQVLIITEKRTPLQYFITPIKDSFYRAFREQ